MSFSNVIVLANCTHASLALTLRNSGSFAKVESAELYSMPPETRLEFADSLAGYDYILTLEHADNFGPLATKALRERFGDKVVSLPTPFFSGLTPDMAYVNRGNELARAEAILGDYHSALVLEEAKAGLSENEIAQRYASGASFERLDIRGVWNDNIDELKRREAENDITLSDFIEERAASGAIIHDFLSFNHPTEALINHIVDKFTARILGQRSQSNYRLTAEDHNLYHDAYWPVHPVVSQTMGLPINERQMFKAPARLGGALMTFEEFARASYRFFTQNGSVEDYQAVTPWFVTRHFKSAHSPK